MEHAMIIISVYLVIGLILGAIVVFNKDAEIGIYADWIKTEDPRILKMIVLTYIALCWLLLLPRLRINRNK